MQLPLLAREALIAWICADAGPWLAAVPALNPRFARFCMSGLCLHLVPCCRGLRFAGSRWVGLRAVALGPGERACVDARSRRDGSRILGLFPKVREHAVSQRRADGRGRGCGVGSNLINGYVDLSSVPRLRTSPDGSNEHVSLISLSTQACRLNGVPYRNGNSLTATTILWKRQILTSP